MKTKEIIQGIRSNDQCKGVGQKWMDIDIVFREDFCCIPPPVFGWSLHVRFEVRHTNATTENSIL